MTDDCPNHAHRNAIILAIVTAATPVIAQAAVDAVKAIAKRLSKKEETPKP